MSELLLHEASLEELCEEIGRRTTSAAVIYARLHEKADDVVEQNYVFHGGIHAAYGLATELKHRLKEILLADELEEEAP